MKKILLALLVAFVTILPVSAIPTFDSSTLQEVYTVGAVYNSNGEVVRQVNLSREGYNAYVTLAPGETFQTYQYQSKDFIGAIGSFSTSGSSTEVEVCVRKSSTVGGSRTVVARERFSPTDSPSFNVGYKGYWGCWVQNSSSVYYDVVYKNTGSTTTNINFQLFYGTISIS